MKSAGKARSNGLYRHIRTSKEIIRNLLNDLIKNLYYLIININPKANHLHFLHNFHLNPKNHQLKDYKNLQFYFRYYLLAKN